ncbi:nitronate monooxygenase [Mycobacterium heckeshornense]|uniref:Oxidoreductase, 2-nitropropane dioxygenase family protein n=1 Tax=Mycobacterium heckeshornense TaxID=110505 RepID=A0A2G8BD42_9MYCO|nr:nitronate monooxygenase family protein [Mycobacterium heckeshornense]KMV22991.1 monooxygenase [Mycobacterium heckeshornense]MCV7036135.1 nitronate monooxygenase [Mycobacterium heckeshornense]PIJ35665.1 nitronate monooxygenase [Mycobacterium heckeshornense]BCO35805.1 oxidoreductase, 2-nitropropane dioxygenase family protein [Mycobacterium heckeshornense]BCQ08961.1 oxidoreductase, 2-nitropropane dioxygenase family protein [Mycobacterium heckeshornense]
MHTPICDEFGIEFPIFAFTHCRDVVVAVGKAGGFGVLGAVGFTPEQLEIELNWIDEHIGEHPYGVDIVIPNKYEGMDAHMSADELKKTLQAMVPKEHLDFARKILADHGVPVDDLDDNAMQLLGWTEATATPQVQVALNHPKVALIANALGTPPADMIKHIHDAGRKVAALCGSPSQARKHADADVDIIIAQGGEGGGHCGEIGSIVLWPQVVTEVAPRPVLAAGGIASGYQIAAALAVGAQGAWTGSQWLMVEEAANTPVQQATYAKATSKDTVRSRSFTGKPARMLRNDWTDAWEQPGNPKPLGMPLQYMVSGMAVAATQKYPDQTVDVAFNPIGQVVGQLTKVEKTAAVIERWVQEYLEATNRLNQLNEAATV